MGKIMVDLESQGRCFSFWKGQQGWGIRVISCFYFCQFDRPENFKNVDLRISRGRKTMYLVGGFNPLEKYARQIGSFPQSSGWKFQKYLSCHHPVYLKKRRGFLNIRNSRARNIYQGSRDRVPKMVPGELRDASPFWNSDHNLTNSIEYGRLHICMGFPI